MNEYGPFNPGIKSSIPVEYRKLLTYLNSDNVYTSIRDAEEFAKFSGLREIEVVACKPERLVLHEVLLRVMTRTHVPDGKEYLDFGKTYRSLVQKCLDSLSQEMMDNLQSKYDLIRQGVQADIKKVLEETVFKDPLTENNQGRAQRGLSRFFSWISSAKPKNSDENTVSLEEKHALYVSDFKEKSMSGDDEQSKAVYGSLYRLGKNTLLENSRFVANKDLYTLIATNMACNDYASRVLGTELEDIVKSTLAENGYDSVPLSDDATIVSLKGASASGKSTLRMQISQNTEGFLGGLGVNTLQHFAIISPDICRKAIIDYSSLGDAFKYAGMLTAEELEVIDKKIDRYLTEISMKTNKIPNLLIDRFRFDTFSTDRNSDVDTFVSYSNHLHMFFVVTDPEAILERGWIRGTKTGRYRSVEDFLALSLEAHNGMPNKFFEWIDKNSTEFTYEFMDNNVPLNERQRIIAYGDRQEMFIRDVGALIDLCRYQKVNVNATAREALYSSDGCLHAKNNLDFLKACSEKLPTVSFVDQHKEGVYARVSQGKAEIIQPDIYAQVTTDEDLQYAFGMLGFPDVHTLGTIPETQPEI